MRFEGQLTHWDDARGFGRIESTQGGEPIFMHISAWPRNAGRPRLGQRLSFAVETGPKGKRAADVRPALDAPATRAGTRPGARRGPAQWGTASLFAIPALLVLWLALSVWGRLALWVPLTYAVMSGMAFVAYALDKSAAERGAWRISEGNLHLLSLLGGWPGALVAQQRLRHKSTKHSFRQVFWGTVVLNLVGLVLIVSPLGAALLAKAG